MDASSTVPATREPASATAHTRHATRPFSHARPFAACARCPRRTCRRPPRPCPGQRAPRRAPRTRCDGGGGGSGGGGVWAGRVGSWPAALVCVGRGPRPRRPPGQRAAHSPMAWLEGGRDGTAAPLVAHGAVIGGKGARRRGQDRECAVRAQLGPSGGVLCAGRSGPSHVPLAMAPRPSPDTPPPTRRHTGPTTAQQREHPRRRTGLRRGESGLGWAGPGARQRRGPSTAHPAAPATPAPAHGSAACRTAATRLRFPSRVALTVPMCACVCALHMGLPGHATTPGGHHHHAAGRESGLGCPTPFHSLPPAPPGSWRWSPGLARAGSLDLVPFVGARRVLPGTQARWCRLGAWTGIRHLGRCKALDGPESRLWLEAGCVAEAVPADFLVRVSSRARTLGSRQPLSVPLRPGTVSPGDFPFPSLLPFPIPKGHWAWLGTDALDG